MAVMSLREDWNADIDTGSLNWPVKGRVLTQSRMCARPVVVEEVRFAQS
jgi:hypothetical protein